MKESYDERSSDPHRPRVMRHRPRGRGRSVGRGTCRPAIEPRKEGITSGCRRRGERRKAIPAASTAREANGPGAVADPAHARTHLAREPGDPAIVGDRSRPRPHREVYGRTPMMHGDGKSDTAIVPEKPPNNAGGPAAEEVEGRAVANGNSLESNGCRTQGRESARS